jgi:flagellar export protein FliJ
MKRFDFPLERVRQYRELQLETEHAKLDQLLAKLHALDQLEANLARQRLDADDDLRRRTAAGTPVNPAEVASMTGFRAYCKQMAQALAARRAELEHQIAIQRREVLEARRRYEVLDRFRTRQKKRWSFELGKEQDALADENYLARWPRQA